MDLTFSHPFEESHDAFFSNDPNHNGIYNGLNLAGLDIARPYLALHQNTSLTIPEFLSGEETFYNVTLPKSPHCVSPKLYSWMITRNQNQQASSEVYFA